MTVMYKHYMEKKFNPTYARLETDQRLQDFLQQRCYLLQNRLFLPPCMFAGRDILEFGPAGGENALIFALLGAQMHLVEPVASFHDTIRAYFNQYGQSSRLKLVTESTLSDFVCEDLFDMVVAEGFAYTTGSAELWTKKLSEFCGDGSHVLFSFLVTGGFLVEMLQSRVCRIAGALHRLDEIDTAQIILGQKWQRLPHSRSFDSWARDVLYHPCVDYSVLNHVGTILKWMYEWGFDLYSAWPQLQPPLDVSWIRRQPCRKEKLEIHNKASLYLLPSLILGETVRIKNPENILPYENLSAALDELMHSLSDLAAETIHTNKILSNLDRCETFLQDVVQEYSCSRLAKLVIEIRDCLHSLEEHPEELAKRFGADRMLGTVWGSPNQYVVFQKGGSV